MQIYQVEYETADGQITFGPVFNKTFLETIFKLQEDIQLVIKFLIINFFSIVNRIFSLAWRGPCWSADAQRRLQRTNDQRVHWTETSRTVFGPERFWFLQQQLDTIRSNQTRSR